MFKCSAKVNLGDKSITQFNGAIKDVSFAITNPDHCKRILSQNPQSADPVVKAYNSLGSLDLLIALADYWASKVSLTCMAIPS